MEEQWDSRGIEVRRSTIFPVAEKNVIKTKLRNLSDRERIHGQLPCHIDDQIK